MRKIMLDELDARVLFLPQLEMAIDRSRNDEVRAGKGEEGGCKPILVLANESRTGAPCDNDKVYHIAMHKTLVVPVCAWQMVQEKPFMWEN